MPYLEDQGHAQSGGFNPPIRKLPECRSLRELIASRAGTEPITQGVPVDPIEAAKARLARAELARATADLEFQLRDAEVKALKNFCGMDQEPEKAGAGPFPSGLVVDKDGDKWVRGRDGAWYVGHRRSGELPKEYAPYREVIL